MRETGNSAFGYAACGQPYAARIVSLRSLPCLRCSVNGKLKSIRASAFLRLHRRTCRLHSLHFQFGQHPLQASTGPSVTVRVVATSRVHFCSEPSFGPPRCVGHCRFPPNAAESTRKGKRVLSFVRTNTPVSTVSRIRPDVSGREMNRVPPPARLNVRATAPPTSDFSSVIKPSPKP